MTDHFATLQEPRRPWLDPEAIQQKFLQLSPAAHPDHADTARAREQAGHRFAELNAAHNCLRDPKERLQHLLLLETGHDARQVRQVPAAVAELILPIEQLCRDAAAFSAEKARATSPLVQARLFEQALEWTDRIAAARQTLASFRTQLDTETRALNPAWAAADGITGANRATLLPMAELENLFRAFSYVTRFDRQLQERAVQLML